MRTCFILAVILVAAFIIRVWNFSEESFWVDEVATVKILKAGDFSECLQKIWIEELNPPLYFILLKFWADAFGATPEAIRFFSVIFGFLSVMMFFMIAQQYFQPLKLIFAIIVFAFSPFTVFYSQEARSYALFLFLGLLFFWYALRVERISSLSIRTVAIASILMALILYTHPLGVFIPLCWIAASFTSASLSSKKKVLLPVIFSVLLYLPWIAKMVGMIQNHGLSVRQWIPSLSMKSLGAVLLHYGGALPPYPQNFHNLRLELALAMVLSSVVLIICSVAFVRSLQRLLRLRRRIPYRFQILLLWFSVPTIGIFAFSLFFSSLVIPRYFLMCYPFWVLLVFIGIPDKRVQRWGGLVAILTILCLVIDVSRTNKEEWNRVVPFVEQKLRTGDAIVFHPGFIADAYNFYSHDTACPQIRFPIVPRKLTEADERTIDQLTRKYLRIWLITSHSRDTLNILPRVLQRERIRCFDSTFVGIAVQLFAYPSIPCQQ